jgi:hypothetical protein
MQWRSPRFIRAAVPHGVALSNHFIIESKKGISYCDGLRVAALAQYAGFRP